MLSSRALIRSSTRRTLRPTSFRQNSPPLIPTRFRSFQMTSTADAPKASTSAQPEWTRPIPQVPEPVLEVYNSMTRKKEVFTPVNGRRVDWYNCGPTVYDSSHMGHARNYLTQDIIRRILQNYFGYDVNFVMNITDIDDKIIIRARESYLINQTLEQNSTLTPELLETANGAFEKYLDAKLVKSLPHPVVAPSSSSPVERFEAILDKYNSDSTWASEAKAKEEKFDMYINSLVRARDAIRIAEEKLKASDKGGAEGVKELLNASADTMGPYLGSTLGDTIENPIEVARDLAAFWENKFFEDMARLHILPPDITTRVSEYVDEIVSFVERIEDNGFAYEGGGSVWFDVAKFEGAEGDGFRHEYAKLQPGSKGNKKLIDEGEGALTAAQGKKQAADFALWKAKSKPGEPAWQSRRWGEGRPGWHIECSVMASDILGKGMDIHSGGVDLMFPHHDNELAQSEAYHGCKQWVNYFLHTGHLHIEGLKMSKSLKNFITIEEALETYTPRQLRLSFMLQTWNAKMDFRRDLISDVKTKEETFDNFFTNVKARLRERTANPPAFDGKHHFDEPEKALVKALHETQHKFRENLCDSFNTPRAIETLLDLVATVNRYLTDRGQAYNISPVKLAAEWVTRMLSMFGLGEGAITASEGQIGWGEKGEVAGAGDLEAQLDKYLRAMASFRDDVRKIAIEGGSSKSILELCDRFRDQDLVNLGVQLDDGQGAGGGALYKLVDPAILIKQREEKAAIAADKAAKKAANAAAAEQQKKAQLEKGRVAPSDMFKPPHSELYSAWDENGLPTKDAQGSDVSKAGGKKLLKEYKTQEKAHEAFLAWEKEQ